MYFENNSNKSLIPKLSHMSKSNVVVFVRIYSVTKRGKAKLGEAVLLCLVITKIPGYDSSMMR